MAEHIYTYDDPPSERHMAQAVKILEAGGVLALPAGNSWAFACNASSSKALERIRRLNPSHPRDKSFSLICADIAMASSVGNIDHGLYRVLKKAWPGPYTIIVKRNRTLPKQIKDKRQVVGIRIPDCRMLLGLVKAFDGPLATTSLPSKDDFTPYKMGYEVFETFGHALDLVLDLGEELDGSESTVVDFSEGEAELVREGAGDLSIFGL